MTTQLNFDYYDRSGEYVAYYNGDEDSAPYRVRAVRDDYDRESPRDWDNACVMVCEHRRYNLGDDDGLDRAREAVRASRSYRPTWEESESGTFKVDGTTHDCVDLYDAAGAWYAIQLCADIVSQPLYLYDHSGITISTGKFSCPWDSGQVGFAFIDKRKMVAEMGKARWASALRDWARRMIEAEVETYDQFIRGDVYGCIVERRDSDDPDEWEDVDSCWGFYGSDFDESGLAEAALNVIECELAASKRERTAKLKDLIRARAPLAARQAVLSAYRLEG